MAVKTISKEKVNVDFDSIKKELDIMKAQDHPNIIKLYDMKEYKQNNYSLIDLNYILLRDKKLFRSID